MVNKKLISILIIMLVIVSISVIGLRGVPVSLGKFNLANTAVVAASPVLASSCPDIQKLQVSCDSLISKQCKIHRMARKDVCESVKTSRMNFCTFKQGKDAEGQHDPSKDFCNGIPGTCPDMTLYGHYDDDYEVDEVNFGRKSACESTIVKGVKCMYDGGSAPESADDDKCSLDIDGDGINNKEDSCPTNFAGIIVQTKGPKIGAPMGDYNGDCFVNKKDLEKIKGNYFTFLNEYVEYDGAYMHEFIKGLVMGINEGADYWYNQGSVSSS